jgi:hypothetical protein
MKFGVRGHVRAFKSGDMSPHSKGFPGHGSRGLHESGERTRVARLSPSRNLRNRIITIVTFSAKALCHARLHCAKGAVSLIAWGHAPGIQSPTNAALKARFKTAKIIFLAH